MVAKVKADFGGLEDLEDKLKKLNGLALTIGFQGESGGQLYPTGINVATVALYNEFGTRGKRFGRGANRGIPARSFLRRAIFENRSEIRKLFAREMRKVFLVKGAIGPLEALGNIGEGIAKMVKRKVIDAKLWATPNAPATIKKKGFDFPLKGQPSRLDSLLSNSISWAVRDIGARGSIITLGVV